MDVAAVIAREAPDIRRAVLHVGAANVGRFGDQPLTLDAARALAVARLMPDAVVVPVHADGWAHFLEPVDAVARAFDEGGVGDRLRVLEPGTETEIAIPDDDTRGART